MALVGDGSFQLIAQEASTTIRCGLKPIIFLINNGGYTIEAETHDGRYNTIRNWNYVEKRSKNGVMCHLMFGILALTTDQLMRFLE
jgi:TPP-dependent 2-oxoacid decarboxylase